MKKIFLTGLLLMVVLHFYGCGASVKMVDSWVDKSKAGYSVDNVLVIGISREEIARNLWENTFVELLGKNNIKAQANNIVSSGQTLEPDRQSILAAVKKSGADTVLITRVVGLGSKEKTRPGVVHYEPAAFYMGLEDYYGNAYRAVYNPPVNYTESVVRLESNLYDVATEKLVWSAQSEAVDAKLLKTDYAKMANLLIDDLRKKKLL